MAKSFFQEHPFIGGLVKRIITLVVTWQVVLLLIGFTFSGFIFFGIMMAATATESDFNATSYEHAYGSGANSLLSIKVSGTIVGSEAENSFDIFGDDGYVSGYDVKKQLITAAADETIHGVVLEVNSPGGTIYGSRAIADGIAFYKKSTGNPVYAHIEGLGASGGYWAAVVADKIYADYGSDIGSIGVIMGPFQYYDKVLSEDGGLFGGGVLTQNGIETTMITAGKSKDAGSPYRRLTADEIKVLQQSVNNEYDNFVQFVSQNRKIPADVIRNQIGALAYDNKTAEQYKLIDGTASREDAYHKLAEAAGIERDFQVLRSYYDGGFMQSLFSAFTDRKPKQVSFDACNLTRTSLAYHGSVAGFCAAKSDQ